MVDHLQHGALDAEAVEREEAVGDEPHLRERRVRDHAAHVGCAERQERAVDEADRGQHEDRRLEVVRRLGELGDRDPQEAVRGHLRDHAREQARDLGRRLAVGVRQPAVEREERRFDGEGDREAEEQPVIRARPHLDEVERALLDAEDDDRRQHQQRAGDRVDDEFDRRPEPAGAAPDADQDVERDQHRLEERVEEQQVLRAEDADDRAGEEEQQPEVGARPLPARPPRVAAGDGAADDGQPDEPGAERVLADVVAHAERREPRVLLVELQRRVAEVDVLDGREPEADLHQRDERRQRTDPLRAASARAR